METRPTWTRYGNAIIMMKRTVASKKPEQEKEAVRKQQPSARHSENIKIKYKER